jgi:hypothetical protein
LALFDENVSPLDEHLKPQKFQELYFFLKNDVRPHLLWGKELFGCFFGRVESVFASDDVGIILQALHKLNKELTKATKTIASDETFRAVVDKTQGVMAFDAVKKAVVKATSREAGPPKEKHVQFLLHATSDPTINIQDILNDMYARLRLKDATVHCFLSSWNRKSLTKLFRLF